MGAVAHNKSHTAIGSSVYDIVKDLRADAASLAFPIPIAGAQSSSQAQTLLLAQLDDHLLPRLAELSTPAIVVIAGSTGTGKSTLANSLVGTEVSPAGVIRPTTLEPVLIVHPDDEELLQGTSLLAGVTVRPHDAVPRGVALLDAPDLDSVRDENRETARKLLESADMWLFVTTANRYGDALPWKTLTSAVKRGTKVAMILNRVPTQSRRAVEADLRNRLSLYDLGEAPLFVVPDQGPHHGLLPDTATAEVRSWLHSLSGENRAQEIIVSTLKGSLSALPPRLLDLANAVDDQVAAKRAIVIEARKLLVHTVQKIRTAVADCSLVDGAAQAAWSNFSSGAGLNKVLDRSGYARGSSRTVRARESAAAEALPRLSNVLVAAGIDTVEDSRSILRRGLQGLEGGEILQVSAFPDREEEVTAVVDGWLTDIRAAISSFAQVRETKQVNAAIKRVGVDALHVIVVCAVLGQDNASELLRMLLGNESSVLVDEARTELADHYDRLILGEYVYVTQELDRLGLEEGSSARIRVRLAELKKIR